MTVGHATTPAEVAGPHVALRASIRELIHYRELLYLVTLREIKVRYRPPLFGACWAVLQPLSPMLILTLFLSILAQVGNGPIPYPLFSYIGLLCWVFFANSVSLSATSLLYSPHLIHSIYFPREVLPLSAVLSALLDFAVASAVLVPLMLWYGVALHWTALYLAPLLLIQITFTIACCLMLAAATALYRDVRFTVPFLIQLGMFVTPILYPASVVPEAARILYLTANPMAIVVEGSRMALLEGRPPDPLCLAIGMLLSTVLLCLAYTCFKHLERSFTDTV